MSSMRTSASPHKLVQSTYLQQPAPRCHVVVHLPHDDSKGVDICCLRVQGVWIMNGGNTNTCV